MINLNNINQWHNLVLFTHLWWPTQQQPPWVKGVHSALISVVVVHMDWLGNRPLAVVQRLLCACHHLAHKRTKRTCPHNRMVRQEGRGFGKSTAVCRSNNVINQFGQENYGRLFWCFGHGALRCLQDEGIMSRCRGGRRGGERWGGWWGDRDLGTLYVLFHIQLFSYWWQVFADCCLCPLVYFLLLPFIVICSFFSAVT